MSSSSALGERAGMTAVMASAAVELADLVIAGRVLAVAHQLGGDAAAGSAAGQPRFAAADLALAIGRARGARTTPNREHGAP